VPEITPVAVLSVNPVGSEPDATAHDTVPPAPPLYVNCWLYAIPMLPSGSEVVVTVGNAGTTIDSDCVAEVCVPTATVTPNVYVAPAALLLVVPEISPVALLRLNPAGSEPLTTLHTGVDPLPPVKLSCWLYVAPASALGSELVVTVGTGAAIVNVYVCVTIFGVVVLSVRLTVIV